MPGVALATWRYSCEQSKRSSLPEPHDDNRKYCLVGYLIHVKHGMRHFGYAMPFNPQKILWQKWCNVSFHSPVMIQDQKCARRVFYLSEVLDIIIMLDIILQWWFSFGDFLGVSHKSG